MRITVEKIMSWRPCQTDYPEARVREIIGAGKTPLEICELDIPVQDRFWVLLRPEIISDSELHALACVFAEDALNREREAGREPHPASWAAIEAKRKWIRGEISDVKLKQAEEAARVAAWKAGSAAWDTAWAAAWAAARKAGSAAWDTARAAARDAAWDVASDAAWASWDAARDAAWDAARDETRDAAWEAGSAAWDTARAKQLEQIKMVLIK